MAFDSQFGKAPNPAQPVEIETPRSVPNPTMAPTPAGPLVRESDMNQNVLGEFLVGASKIINSSYTAMEEARRKTEAEREASINTMIDIDFMDLDRELLDIPLDERPEFIRDRYIEINKRYTENGATPKNILYITKSIAEHSYKASKQFKSDIDSRTLSEIKVDIARGEAEGMFSTAEQSQYMQNLLARIESSSLPEDKKTLAVLDVYQTWNKAMSDRIKNDPQFAENISSLAIDKFDSGPVKYENIKNPTVAELEAVGRLVRKNSKEFSDNAIRVIADKNKETANAIVKIYNDFKDIYNIDEESYRAYILSTVTETGTYRINETSPTGASGPSQLTGTAIADVNKKYGTNIDRNNLESNILGGMLYMDMMMKSDPVNGNTLAAIHSYHRGLGLYQGQTGNTVLSELEYNHFERMTNRLGVSFGKTILNSRNNNVPQERINEAHRKTTENRDEDIASTIRIGVRQGIMPFGEAIQAASSIQDLKVKERATEDIETAFGQKAYTVLSAKFRENLDPAELMIFKNRYIEDSGFQGNSAFIKIVDDTMENILASSEQDYKAAKASFDAILNNHVHVDRRTGEHKSLSALKKAFYLRDNNTTIPKSDINSMISTGQKAFYDYYSIMAKQEADRLATKNGDSVKAKSIYIDKVKSWKKAGYINSDQYNSLISYEPGLSGRIADHENFVKIYASKYRQITGVKDTGVVKDKGILQPKNVELYNWVYAQVLNDKDITNKSSVADIEKKVYYYLSKRIRNENK